MAPFSWGEQVVDLSNKLVDSLGDNIVVNLRDSLRD